MARWMVACWLAQVALVSVAQAQTPDGECTTTTTVHCTGAAARYAVPPPPQAAPPPAPIPPPNYPYPPQAVGPMGAYGPPVMIDLRLGDGWQLVEEEGRLFRQRKRSTDLPGLWIPGATLFLASYL